MLQKLFLLLMLFTLFGCSVFQNKMETPKFSGSYELIPSKEDLTSNRLKFKLEIFRYRLENGLTVLLVENRKLPIFSYHTFYDVGGRFETPNLIGGSHFLEHMMFKGAKKFGPGEFDTFIEGSGGNNNAYTSSDSTVYHESLSAKGLDKIIDLEADRMQNLLLEPTSFEKERNVILEERRVNYDNKDRSKLFLQMMSTMFKGTPYGQSVIGTKENISALKREDVADYFKKYYSPNNAVLVVVGDFDQEQTIETINQIYGPIPRLDNLKVIRDLRDRDELYVTDKVILPKTVNIHGSAPNPIFMMTYKGLPLGDKKSYAMDILSSILADGQSSYLYQKFVNNRRPVLSYIGASNYGLKKGGVFILTGELLGKKSLKSFKKRLVAETKKMCDKSINERSVQKTKNQFMIGYYGQIQTNSGVASFIGNREHFHGDYGHYVKELEIYENMTVKEVKDVCHQLFDSGKYAFLSIWKHHKK